jgi:hypothetical protein
VKPLISLFSFYIKSSIHVALGVTGLVYVTSIEFGVTLPVAFYWISFLGTITGYNFIKYAEIAGLQHKSLIRSLQNLQVFSLVVFCLLVYFLTQLHLVVLTYLFVLGFLTLLYVIPTINHKNFRSMAGVKVFVVALVWSGLTVLVPVYYANSVPPDLWLCFAQRFFIVLALIIPFEIRDLTQDKTALVTFPQLLGIQKTKLLGGLLLIFTLLLEGLKQPFVLYKTVPLLIVCLLIALCLYRTRVHQSKYFASFWVEGIASFWAMMLWLTYFILV